MSESPQKLKMYIDGAWLESRTSKFMNCFNPSTGEVVALAPQCTAEEVELAIQAAKTAFPKWADTPASQRADFTPSPRRS